MYVDCAHGKGIRFFRDQLKFFAKTNIQHKNNIMFKSIILFNADKLTTDAQSALRRCIERFSHNTRFFIIAENQKLLLNPILSRFCSIYIPTPKVNNEYINFYNILFDTYNNKDYIKKEAKLKKYLKDDTKYKSLSKSIKTSPLTKGWSESIPIPNLILGELTITEVLVSKFILPGEDKPIVLFPNINMASSFALSIIRPESIII